MASRGGFDLFPVGSRYRAPFLLPWIFVLETRSISSKEVEGATEKAQELWATVVSAAGKSRVVVREDAG